MLVQAQPVVPIEQQEPARAQVGRGLVREVDALGLHRRRRIATAACSSTPPTSSCATCTAPATRCGPATTASIARAARSTCPNTRNFPKNTEIDMTLTFVNEAGGGAAAAAAAVRRRVRRRSAQAGGGGGGRRPRRRPVLGLGRQRDADARRGDAARARVVRRAAGRQLHSRASTIRAPATAASASSTTARRSASRCSIRYIRRHRLREEGSGRGDERAGQADSVLGRLGRARRREEGAGRRRELVEPGVRSRRLPQRVQGRRAARRRRPDGHPLQHDQLGPPLDARLELGRHRSPIRAPARSSRRRSRSARCAIARTT